MFERRKTREVKVGSVLIGGNAPISIQSMTNTPTEDVSATFRQVRALEDAGADIVRITAPTVESVATFARLKEMGIKVPLVADIHFDYKIALAAIDAGVDKIRINPGNIGSREKTEAVVRACRERGVPIRIGVNSGSLEKEILREFGAPTAEALAKSALYHARILDELDFHDYIISVKASDVPTMLSANRILAGATDCPLHLGVTEAGARDRALIKSSIGIGALLSEGIGDTVRVSLTDDPVKEIYAAREILNSIGLSRVKCMDIVSCPTCGRTRIDLIPILKELEDRIRTEGLDTLPIKVAVMGCAVNGPGEAREADIGIAGGVGEALLFKKGEIVGKIKEDRLIDELIREIKIMAGKR
ncbi:MAG: flavodoxin-dependent (E)-4-hydroxy-3-methylbut-2-enyl-diphosphate synthase [Clostridia bacterium]|nr:flavodoxin-dependent (E)-4-hydroxy-3-methylbut-2-enyl-diphosphate synthase [Clostridia bacterium]